MDAFTRKFASLTNLDNNPLLQKLSQDAKDILTIDDDKAYNIFDKNFKLVKGLGLTILFMMAIRNYFKYKNIGLFSKNPTLFLAESITIAVFTIIPYMMLTYLRDDHHTKQEIAISILGIFVFTILLNYLLELSGIYAVTFKEDRLDNNGSPTEPQPQSQPQDDNDDDNDDQKSSYDKLWDNFSVTSQILVILIVVGSALAMVTSSLYIMNTDTGYIRDLKGYPQSVIFAIEMVLFGVISSFPLFLMASNRSDLSKFTVGEFGVLFLKTSFMHVVLQLSGFYKYSFSG